MARTVRPKPGTKPAGAKRPAAAQPAREAAKPQVKPAKARNAPRRGATGQALPAAAAIPEAPANAFQDRLEKIEKTNATLRSRLQAAARAAKAWEARVTEVEARLEALEQRMTQVQRAAEPNARQRRARRPRDIDPGDAVPEGVAVQTPQPLDAEAESALEHLQHLGDE
jgi:chromosome segregation ATPase